MFGKDINQKYSHNTFTYPNLLWWHPISYKNKYRLISGGKVKATLIGSKGSTLKYLMQYADSTWLTLFGGVGECIYSDESVIDVVW